MPGIVSNVHPGKSAHIQGQSSTRDQNSRDQYFEQRLPDPARLSSVHLNPYDLIGLQKGFGNQAVEQMLNRTALQENQQLTRLPPAGWNVIQRQCGHPDCKDPDCHDPGRHTEYEQSEDPSIQPHLPKGQKFMGQAAMEKQREGVVPEKEDVRVQAVKKNYSRAGAGKHEMLPTDIRGEIAQKGSAVDRGFQSGGRSDTDLTVLVNPSGHLAGHTGMFPTSGRGSSHTSGQAEAHDQLRQLSNPGSSAPEQMLGHSVKAVSTLAHGQQIMSSADLTGAKPNTKGMEPLEAPVERGRSRERGGGSRLALAQDLHERREKMKDHIRSYAKSNNLPAPRDLSPVRTPIRDDGTGGEYAQEGQRHRDLSPVPKMRGNSPDQVHANEAAWISAPYRHHSPAATSKDCPHCGRLNYTSGSKKCAHCGQPL